MASLPPHLRRVDGLRSAAAIAFDWSVVLAAAAVSNHLARPDVYLLAIALIAGRMQAMWCLGHEATHGGLLKNRRWNDRISDWLVLYPLLYPRTAVFRGWHMKHHRLYWQDEDPVAQYIRSLGPPGTTRQRVWQLVVRPLLGGDAWAWLCDRLGDPRPWLRALVLWIPALAIAYHLGVLHLVALYWVVPLVWLAPVFESWSGVCDHYNTRTGVRSTLGLFARTFTHGHNNGHHWVHHHHPAVVWHQLPEAERLLAPEDRDVANNLAEILHQIFVLPPQQDVSGLQ